MDPLFLFIGLFVFAIGLFTIGSNVAGEPTRMCPQCGDQVSIRARACRGCRYRFGRL